MQEKERHYVASTPLAGDSETSNWPCIQHKAPEITAGMMWAGREIDEMEITPIQAATFCLQ
jgi:hypothetical protein